MDLPPSSYAFDKTPPSRSSRPTSSELEETSQEQSSSQHSIHLLTDPAASQRPPEELPVDRDANSRHATATMSPHYSSNDGNMYTTPNRRMIFARELVSPPPTLRQSYCLPQVVGDPSLRIYKLRLPPHLLPLLDLIVFHCEQYAATLPNGWRTNLYSLTKQDLSLADIPALHTVYPPICHYIHQAIARLFVDTNDITRLRVDRNQPHVLKYSQHHRGVVLHRDLCDVTANLSLSRRHSYGGGGTFLPAVTPTSNAVVRLEYGEFLLHPGGIVHSGLDITSGMRYLMVLFVHLEPPNY